MDAMVPAPPGAHAARPAAARSPAHAETPGMSRTTRLLQGLAFGYANQVLVTLVGIWLTAFLLGELGQADYGVWLGGTRVLGYLLLLGVGGGGLVPRGGCLSPRP